MERGILLVMVGKKLQKVRLTGYDFLAFAIILIATLLRLTLIYFNWPITNSDEGNMGMLALHVAYKGEWPIFLYGQLYMGPLEGYLAAPLFHVFGPSLFTLRLGLLCFSPLFLLCMYYLTVRLYNHKFALFMVLVLSVGSDETILRQVKAVGEYPETIFFAALISLLAVWIVQTGHAMRPERRTSWPRFWIYGLLGIVVGLAFWVDMLILPVVGSAFLLLLLFCRRELWSRLGIGLGMGMIIGAFPLVVHNVTAPFEQNSLVVLFNLHRSNGGQEHTFVQQVLGTVGISIPDVMNFNPMCIEDVAELLDGKQVACAVAQLGWGTGYFICFGFALITTTLLVWHSWRGAAIQKQEWSFERRKAFIDDCGRLMLLVGAGGTILAYVTSPNPATVPAPTARYLTCLLIALPAVLWPLWKGLYEFAMSGGDLRRTAEKGREVDEGETDRRKALSLRRGVEGREVDEGETDRRKALSLRRGGLGGQLRWVNGLQVGGLLLFLVMSIFGMYNTFAEIPAAQRFYASQDELIRHLVEIGATRFYAEYWTCNRLIFQSNERVICSPLDEKLGPGFDRYMPYRTQVQATRDAAYVFPKGAAQVTVMDEKIKSDALKRSYRREEFGDYVIYYVPRQPLGSAKAYTLPS